MKDHSENRTENRTNNCKNQSQNRTTNQTTIYVRVREQFFSVRRLAATTVKDRSVVSDFLAILVSYD